MLSMVSELNGIAIGPAQAQYPLGAMLGEAESATNRCHRPDARKQAGLSFHLFPFRLRTFQRCRHAQYGRRRDRGTETVGTALRANTDLFFNLY